MPSNSVGQSDKILRIVEITKGIEFKIIGRLNYTEAATADKPKTRAG